MKTILMCALLVSLAGCATRAESPMVVGKSYQLRLSDSASVAQVRVIDSSGDWVRLSYLENSPRVDNGVNDVWVNSNHIMWFIPYETSQNAPMQRTAAASSGAGQ